ncbi:hypothetical protein [Thermogymnomonas acidicola]|uniref:GHMP family kinase ATP-binding protein n=1 Tax=Thermogymnomonas acidicola TaxID=399579 RepID=UPI001396A067|nr:hypothetical protein [Thermogymnomonas acidicola]
MACAVSGREQIYVRGGLNPETVRARVEKAMRALRSLSGRDIKVSFYIEMERKYPAGKGLGGESAAVSAAAARAVAGVLGISDPASVSRLARLASGSGTRSVAGPLSLWLSYAYMDERRCYALPCRGGRRSTLPLSRRKWASGQRVHTAQH